MKKQSATCKSHWPAREPGQTHFAFGDRVETSGAGKTAEWHARGGASRGTVTSVYQRLRGHGPATYEEETIEVQWDGTFVYDEMRPEELVKVSETVLTFAVRVSGQVEPTVMASFADLVKRTIERRVAQGLAENFKFRTAVEVELREARR